MSSPGERVPLKRPSLNRERNSDSKWCDLWGMKLNENALTVDGTVLKETDDLVILGVSFDSKIALRTSLFPELQLRGLVSYETQSEIYRRGNVENDWNSSVVRRSPLKVNIGLSSAFQSFPIISDAGSAAFPMLALVGNARDSVL